MSMVEVNTMDNKKNAETGEESRPGRTASGVAAPASAPCTAGTPGATAASASEKRSTPSVNAQRWET